MEIGQKVVVRTEGAGVHFGTLAERNGREVRLTGARRLWSWSGALSLNEVSSKGVDISKSRISEPVTEIILPTMIEIMPNVGNLAKL